MISVTFAPITALRFTMPPLIPEFLMLPVWLIVEVLTKLRALFELFSRTRFLVPPVLVIPPLTPIVLVPAFRIVKSSARMIGTEMVVTPACVLEISAPLPELFMVSVAPPEASRVCCWLPEGSPIVNVPRVLDVASIVIMLLAAMLKVDKSPVNPAPSAITLPSQLVDPLHAPLPLKFHVPLAAFAVGKDSKNTPANSENFRTNADFSERVLIVEKARGMRIRWWGTKLKFP